MHRDIEMEDPISLMHTPTIHQWGAHHVYSTAHEDQEIESDQSATQLGRQKPSILVRLHQALSGVRGTSSSHASSRQALANSNAYESEAGAPNPQDDDRAVFQSVLQKLSKSQPVEERLLILKNLPDLITR